MHLISSTRNSVTNTKKFYKLPTFYEVQARKDLRDDPGQPTHPTEGNGGPERGGELHSQISPVV